MIKLKNKALIRTTSFIHGKWPSSECVFAVDNPATNKTLVQVSEITEQQLEEAVKSSEAAQRHWQKVCANDRCAILLKWQALILENIEDLALLLTLEQGKPIADAIGEINYGNAFISWFAEEAKRIYGDVIPAPSQDKRILALKQAVGVVAAITPWNFPNAMITRKAAAAFAAGCSFIVKPAAETPLSALAIAYLAQLAGLPDGLFNVVIGKNASAIGRTLTTHPSIDKFTFTGSTRIGKLLTEQCASTVKKVSMELGGNAPFIVFDDADLDLAVTALMANKFRNCGQTCISANRVYVHDKIYQAFCDKLTAEVKNLNQGIGTDVSSDIACLIHTQAAQNIHQLVILAEKQGAKIHIGGLHEAPHTAFYPPTILTRVEHGDAITCQEIFGPVIPLIAFSDEAEVINQANDTEAGLASYFFTMNYKRIVQLSEALKYGMVGVNEAAISNAAAPFGGVKQSGFGREGSKYGLDDYLEVKYVCIGGLN